MMSSTEVLELRHSEKVRTNRKQKNYSFTQWSSLVTKCKSFTKSANIKFI